MSNLIDIQLQISKLQKQAADIKAREFDKTLQDIRIKMQAFGITLKDLQTYKPGTKGAKGAKSKKDAASKKRSSNMGAANTATPAKPVAAKYRGPNGETWSGRGLTPRWLATLLEQGRLKDEFAINK